MEGSSSGKFVFIVAVAAAAGVAAGAAAAVTATAFPYALGYALTAVQSKRKKEQREHRHRAKEKVKRASAGAAKEGQNFREAILKGLVKWKDIDTTFDEFPYHLSEITKNALVDSTFVHLKRPDFVKYTTELSPLSPRILLTGPPGCELYQEALVKALARHLQVKLLIFDSTGAYLEASDSMPNNSGRLQAASAVRVAAADELALPLVDAAPRGPAGGAAPAHADMADAEHGPFADTGAMPILPPSPSPLTSPPPTSPPLTSSPPTSPPLTSPPPTSPPLTSPPPTSPPLTSPPPTSPPLTSPPLPSPLREEGEVMDHDPPGTSGGHHGGPSTSSRSSRSRAAAAAPQTDGAALLDGALPLPLPPAASRAKGRSERADGRAGQLEAKVLTMATESSKRALRKGDRVRYVGLASAGGLGGTTVGGPPVGLKGRVLMVLEENPNKVGVRFDKPVYGGNNLVDLCEDGHGYFCNVSELRLEGASGEDVDKLVVEALLEVVSAEAAKEPLLVFMRNVERAVAGHFERYVKLERLERQDVRAVVIGSHTAEPRKEKAAATTAQSRVGNLSALLDLSLLDQLSTRAEDAKQDASRMSKMLAKLFPNRIAIQPPQEEAALAEWTQRLEADAEALKADTNRQRLRMVLHAANMECEGLQEINVSKQNLSQEATEKIVGWGASHHLQTHPQPVVRNGKLAITADSILHGVNAVQAAQATPSSTKKNLKDVACDNEFEKMLLSEVIPPDELGVTFDHIGALDNVKETLRELVMLPLQRPELFVKGQLTKPVRGLLLFGPPGTGKTMLAKAVATEAGANFINVSMATIASKWFGEAEKYVKAVFSLASKIAPSVIFIDEVDSMLGRRGKENEHSAMRKVKNELMSCWDGLRTRERERVLVLAATNRPFDLDEAVIRRFPRRLMIDLPDSENRAKILEVILAEEDVAPDFRVEELAASTDGYSGSDLKNLCTTAAYRRIREILDKEKKERDMAKTEGRELPPPPPSGHTPYIRPLDMEDMRQAMEKVRSSVSQDASTMLELTQWNEQYGEGGTRRVAPLSYFM